MDLRSLHLAGNKSRQAVTMHALAARVRPRAMIRRELLVPRTKFTAAATTAAARPTSGRRAASTARPATGTPTLGFAWPDFSPSVGLMVSGL
jgi:hypothetical protein